MLLDLINDRHKQLSREVENYDLEEILKVPPDELAQYLRDKYCLEPIVLHRENIEIEELGRTVVTTRDPVFDEPVNHDQFGFVALVPFDGDEFLFQYQPSQFSIRIGGSVSADVSAGLLRLQFFRTQHDSSQLNREIDRTLDEMEQNLKHTAEQVAFFNGNLKGKATSLISLHRQKGEAYQHMLSGLKYPIRRRTDVGPITVPTVRRKLPTRPSGDTGKTERWWILDTTEYDNILQIVSNMSVVIERSPTAFQRMQEEDLRWHFLVQLNGHYEGQATGETFNFNGKTDILIRSGNQNVFIAECKFWSGQEGFLKTVDQLLGYVTWRDTKTAILLFVRQKGFSEVLNQIPSTVSRHPSFVRKVGDFKHQTGFRFVLHQKDDPKKELMMTTLAFHVPSPVDMAAK
jgi:hypothetical protein